MWEKDYLDRKKYADFLYTLISNSDKYKRAEGESAYVIALDSPWGTGKTYFLSLFEKWAHEEKKMQVIHYSAWENDFWDNAFLPLLYAIYKNDRNRIKEIKEEGKKYAADILHLALRLTREAGFKKLEEAVGEKGIDIIRDCMDHVEEEQADAISIVFKEYEDFKSAYETVRKMLHGNESDETKLLIVVDELDRCRPDFAVQTLEVVKHLFNVDGLVFLFSVDMEQLGCVIRGIYGESLDARNYLNRLFQYVTHLPEPNVQKYIELLFEEKKKNFEEKHQTDEHKQLFVNIFTEYIKGFQLSLRELDTIWKNYLVLYDYKLKAYIPTEANLCYLLFLIIKYKYADIETEMKRKEQKHLSDMQELKNCVELLPADSQIQDLLNVDIEIPLKSLWGELRYTCNPRRERMDGQISEVKENRLKFIYGEEQVDFAEIWYKTSFAGILYQPDFIHWEQIKNQNIFRYMKDQLELIIFDGERV